MGEDGERWPPAEELERWLMSSVKESADHGSRFMQKMLHMNPAYGQFLAADQNLTGMIETFARRIRAKVLSSEHPILPNDLYEPLCQTAWRVIGYVFHSICDLGSREHDDESSGTPAPPLPKEVIGQVKMLFQTNMDLSNTLSKMRRAYLKELSCHRDKQRDISDRTARALQTLREYPVMFYEPLDFVLDETTKDFVREVINERVKLELGQAPPDENETNRKDGAPQNEGVAGSLAKAMETIKTLRAQLARQGDLMKPLQQKNAAMQKEQEALKAELAAAKAEEAQAKEVQQLKSGDALTASQLQIQLAAAEEKIQQLEKDAVALRIGTRDSQAEMIKARVEAEVQRQLDMSLKVEKELREANRSLEKALEEHLRSADSGSEATQALVADYEQQITEKDNNIANLEEKIKQLEASDSKMGSAEHRKWMDKFEKLQEEHDQMTVNYCKVQDQCGVMMIQLGAMGGEEAVAEARKMIASLPEPVVEPKRRKKAYLRLYDDAQRRITSIRTKAHQINQMEEGLLAKALKEVTHHPLVVRKLQNLKHLQKAAIATTARFHDSFENFTEQHLSKSTRILDQSSEEEDEARLRQPALDGDGAVRSGPLLNFKRSQSTKSVGSVSDAPERPTSPQGWPSELAVPTREELPTRLRKEDQTPQLPSPVLPSKPTFGPKKSNTQSFEKVDKNKTGMAMPSASEPNPLGLVPQLAFAPKKSQTGLASRTEFSDKTRSSAVDSAVAFPAARTAMSLSKRQSDGSFRSSSMSPSTSSAGIAIYPMTGRAGMVPDAMGLTHPMPRASHIFGSVESSANPRSPPQGRQRAQDMPLFGGQSVPDLRPPEVPCALGMVALHGKVKFATTLPGVPLSRGLRLGTRTGRLERSVSPRLEDTLFGQSSELTTNSVTLTTASLESRSAKESADYPAHYWYPPRADQGGAFVVLPLRGQKSVQTASLFLID